MPGTLLAAAKHPVPGNLGWDSRPQLGPFSESNSHFPHTETSLCFFSFTTMRFSSCFHKPQREGNDQEVESCHSEGSSLLSVYLGENLISRGPLWARVPTNPQLGTGEELVVVREGK